MKKIILGLLLATQFNVANASTCKEALEKSGISIGESVCEGVSNKCITAFEKQNYSVLVGVIACKKIDGLCFEKKTLEGVAAPSAAQVCSDTSAG